MNSAMRVDASGYISAITRFHPQARYAIARALTAVAKDVQQETYSRMSGAFDRPSPYALRSMYVRSANKVSLTAEVGVKNSQSSKSAMTPTDVLGQQFMGGGRNAKRIEKLFARAGYISAGEYLSPGQGAKLDQYGNISRGQVMQIAAQLKATGDGATSSTGSKRSKRNTKKAGEFFWSRGGRLKRGVWMRNGRSVRPVLMVVSPPSYKSRINLQKIAEDVVAARFESHLRAGWAVALSSVR